MGSLSLASACPPGCQFDTCIKKNTTQSILFILFISHMEMFKFQRGTIYIRKQIMIM